METIYRSKSNAQPHLGWMYGKPKENIQYGRDMRDALLRIDRVGSDGYPIIAWVDPDTLEPTDLTREEAIRLYEKEQSIIQGNSDDDRKYWL